MSTETKTQNTQATQTKTAVSAANVERQWGKWNFDCFESNVKNMLDNPLDAGVQFKGLEYLCQFVACIENAEDSLKTSMPKRTCWLLFDPMPFNYVLVQIAARTWHALDAIVNVLRKHSDKTGLLQMAVVLLRDFCMNNLENQERVVDLGGMELLLNLTREEYLQYDFVPACACETLLVIVANIQDHVRRFYELGGIETLLNALKNTKSSHKVCERACRTLTFLLELYHPAKNRIRQLDGFAVMDAATEITPSCFDGTITMTMDSDTTSVPVSVEDPVIV